MLIAAGTLAATLVILAHGGLPPTRAHPSELTVVCILLAACSAAPFLAWRRSPAGAFIAATGASVLLTGLGYHLGLALAPAVALYLLAGSRQPPRQWRRSDTITVFAGLVAFLAVTALADGRFPDADLVHTGLGWAVAWFAGERTRLRRVQIEELRARATKAEREAEDDRRLAVAEERARIARDLHDAAGHAINVIAVRASAGRLRFEQDPQRGRLALEAIEEVARETAAEIDQIVHSLREDDTEGAAPVAPPGLASLQTLVDHHASSGLRVSLQAAAGQSRPLSHAADQAAYRILQEALTNAARHGGGTVDVSLRFADDRLELTVINPVTDVSRSRQEGGHGLIGMRERATLLGGTLDARRVDGMFRVRAQLPYAHEGQRR